MPSPWSSSDHLSLFKMFIIYFYGTFLVINLECFFYSRFTRLLTRLMNIRYFNRILLKLFKDPIYNLTLQQYRTFTWSESTVRVQQTSSNFTSVDLPVGFSNIIGLTLTNSKINITKLNCNAMLCSTQNDKFQHLNFNLKASSRMQFLL